MNTSSRVLYTSDTASDLVIVVSNTSKITHNSSFWTNKLWIYFQKSAICGDCDVSDVEFVDQDNINGLLYVTWRVTFSQHSGVQQVLARNDHKLVIDEGTIIDLVVALPQPTITESASASSPDSSLDDLMSFVKVDMVDRVDDSVDDVNEGHELRSSAAILKDEPPEKMTSHNVGSLHMTLHESSLEAGDIEHVQLATASSSTPTRKDQSGTQDRQDSPDDDDSSQDMYGKDESAPPPKKHDRGNQDPNPAIERWARAPGDNAYLRGKGSDGRANPLSTHQWYPPPIYHQWPHQQFASPQQPPTIYDPYYWSLFSGQPELHAHGGHMTGHHKHLLPPGDHPIDPNMSGGMWLDTLTPPQAPPPGGRMTGNQEHPMSPGRETTGTGASGGLGGRIKCIPGSAVRSSNTADIFYKHKEEEEYPEETEEEPEIEVTNYKSGTEETLKLYFGNKRKSGGGDVKTWEKDSKRKAIRITFLNPSVVSAVINKTHKVAGTTLAVKQVIKKKICPRPARKKCLFLTGIPDGCTSELVSLFVEDRIDLEEEPVIQYGEKPGTAICTFATDIPDLEMAIRQVSSKDLNNAKVTAEKVHEPDSILVGEITSKITLETLELYFSNKKKSGGRDVREVSPGPMDGQAIVSFYDWKVVSEVLAKSGSHKLGGKVLTVEDYYDCLGRPTQQDVPTPHIPEPILVNVPEVIMEFIFGKDKNTKKKLMKELGNVKAVLTWPEGGQKTQARLEPQLGDRHSQSSSWLNWADVCTEVLMDFLGEYKSETISIPSPLMWTDVAAKLAVNDSKSYTLIPASHGHEVKLVGEKQDVAGVIVTITNIMKDLQAKIESDAQKIKQELDFPPEKLKLIMLCRIKEEIDQSFPDLKMTVVNTNGKMRLLLEGSRKNVVEAELSMRRQMDNLDHVILKVGDIKFRFVCNVADKIQEVLASNQIHAVCSVSGDGKIIIHGADKKNTEKAKAYIEDEIQEDIILVKGHSAVALIRGQKGTTFFSNINKQRFVAADINPKTGGIELAGFKPNLEETKQKFMSFLKENVPIKELIPLHKNKIRLLTKYHGNELSDLIAQNQKNHVNIQPQLTGRKGFIIQGNERGVEVARQFFTSLIGTIKDRQCHVVKTGMAQLFREDKGKNFLDSLERELQCVIDVMGQEDSDDEEEGSMTATNLTATKILCEIIFPDGIKVKVCRGDLPQQKVDCIVNAANIELKHIGGLAASITRAGGPEIQKESDQLTDKKGKLQVAEAVRTSSGNLPCKNIIHVAGPRWPFKKPVPKADDDPCREEYLLYEAITNCLELATKMSVKSIAIPAISTGVYGFPVKLAAQHIVTAVGDFCQNNPDATLTDINLTNNDQSTCNVFQQTVMDKFSFLLEDEVVTDVDTPGADGVADWNVTPQNVAAAPRFTVVVKDTLRTIEGTTVTMKKGSIAEEMVDIIVNTAGSDMKLCNGKVSQAILQAAGAALQLECDSLMATQGPIPTWNFLETGPGALQCKRIYHSVCGGYNQMDSDKYLKKLVLDLMENAERNELTSIAIPALGTGNLNYPPDVTAQVMYESALEFSSKHPSCNLRDIRFVVYDKDMKTIKGFEDTVQGLITGVVGGAAGQSGSQGAFPRKLKKSSSSGGSGAVPRKLKNSSSSSTNVTDRLSYSAVIRSHGMISSNIGSRCLQILQGDLVKETTDAIVNSIGRGIDQLKGPISQAILAAGGRHIERECEIQSKKDPNKDLYETNAGKLQCKHIVHVVTPSTSEEIKSTVAKALRHAEDRKWKTISIPALGTGQAGQPVSCCASAMLEAIGEFACRKKTCHVQLIRVLLYRRDMLPEFDKTLKRVEGKSYKQTKSFISKSIDLFKSAYSTVSGSAIEDGEEMEEEGPPETIVLNICSMDLQAIDKAVKKIDRFQDEEFTSENFPDHFGIIEKMTAEHKDELKTIEKKLNVHLEFSKGPARYIRVEGLTISVKNALIKIHELFSRIQKDHSEQQLNEHLAKEVQWKYSGQYGVEVYDADINAIIEKAYKVNKPTVKLDLEDGMITINFQAMEESSQRGICAIHRVDLLKAAAFEMPSNWIPMKSDKQVKMVPLALGSPEYIDVDATFRSTVGAITQIEEISRIQNKELLMQYQARKAALESRLGRTDIEKTLYHGSDEDTCNKIHRFGFNRSFCGKNATVYGNGTYFAVDASYSARAQYSKPNANGTKHMYVTKVLVGEYTKGSQNMVTPPHKPNMPGNELNMYDSVVDNVAKPNIFVIFHDAQAYPDYLIKFK